MAYNNTDLLYYGSGEYKSDMEWAGWSLSEAVRRVYVFALPSVPDAACVPCSWSHITAASLTPPSLALTLLPPLPRTLVRTLGPHIVQGNLKIPNVIASVKSLYLVK